MEYANTGTYMKLSGVMFLNLIALNGHLTTQQNAQHKIIDILVKHFFCAHSN